MSWRKIKEDPSRKFYEDEVEYEIRVIKTSDMKTSKQMISGNCKEGIITGACSLLQSLLDSGLINEMELKGMVQSVLEVHDTGARNKILYSNIDDMEDYL